MEPASEGEHPIEEISPKCQEKLESQGIDSKVSSYSLQQIEKETVEKFQDA